LVDSGVLNKLLASYGLIFPEYILVSALRFAVFALFLIVIVASIGAVYYYHLQSSIGQTASFVNIYNNAGYTTSPVTNDGIWDNVVVKVNYSVIDDPGVLPLLEISSGWSLSQRIEAL